MNPIVVATLRPSFNAHMLAPFPKCAMTTRPFASSGASSLSLDARYSHDSP